MANRRGQILFAVFLLTRVLPMRLAIVSTQALCLVVRISARKKQCVEVMPYGAKWQSFLALL